MKSVTMTGQPEVSFDDDTIPTSFVLDKAMRDALREPFPPNQIGQVNKGFGKVDFIGHAAITDRLNKAAPGWTYRVEPVVVTGKDGLPHCMAVFGTITVGGVTRQEVGDVEHMTRYGDELKKAISDFICRGAMRFGVGLDLWSKEQLESLSRETPTEPRTSVGDRSAPSPAGGTDADGGDGVDSDPPSPPNVPGGEPARARAEKAGHGAEPPGPSSPAGERLSGRSGKEEPVQDPGASPNTKRGVGPRADSSAGGTTSGRGKANRVGKAVGTLPETSAGAGDPHVPPSGASKSPAPVTCKHLNGVDVDDRCLDCGQKMKVSA